MVNRVVIDPAYGFRISKAGFDVFSAADKDLLFRDTWRLLRVAKSGAIWIPAANGSNQQYGSQTIPHGVTLSSNNFIAGWALGGGGYGYSVDYFIVGGNGGGSLFDNNNYYIHAALDPWNMRLDYQIGGVSGFGGAELKYVIMDY